MKNTCGISLILRKEIYTRLSTSAQLYLSSPSYLVIPKGRRRDGEEKGIPSLEAGASLSFGRITGLREINI